MTGKRRDTMRAAQPRPRFRIARNRARPRTVCKRITKRAEAGKHRKRGCEVPARLEGDWGHFKQMKKLPTVKRQVVEHILAGDPRG